jgi:ABC-type transporter Mla maintaining outer membrane lipid asymmetry ATPase subunit MlaF
VNKLPYLVAARGIVKSYGPTSVLKGFDLSVAAGEVHAFLGGNSDGPLDYPASSLRTLTKWCPSNRK